MAIYNNFIKLLMFFNIILFTQSGTYVESGDEADDEENSDFVRKTACILSHNLVTNLLVYMYVIVKSKFSIFKCTLIIPFIKSNLRGV